jgi:hypothetical protein
MPTFRLLPAVLFLTLGCSSVLPKPGGQGKADEGPRAIGWNGEFLAVGKILGESGDTVEVQWSSGKATVKKAELAAVLPPGQIKEGQRVIAADKNSLTPLIGTVLAATGPDQIKVKWDLDDKEAEIPASTVALLIRPLCKPEKGCKYGVGKEPGSSAETAAPVAGVKLGSMLAVQREEKGVVYWSPGEVLEILDDGFKVNVRGTGHLTVKPADIRLPVKADELKPGLEIQFGAPPNGLVPGYVVSVEGDTVMVSTSESGTFPQKMKLGTEVFHKR